MLLCVNYSAITEVITSCHTLSLLDALPISTSALGNAFVYHRAVDQIIDYAIHAERDGFDAFVVGSFSEPMLRVMRSAVDIPVIGILRSDEHTSGLQSLLRNSYAVLCLKQKKHAFNINILRH